MSFDNQAYRRGNWKVVVGPATYFGTIDTYREPTGWLYPDGSLIMSILELMMSGLDILFSDTKELISEYLCVLILEGEANPRWLEGRRGFRSHEKSKPPIRKFQTGRLQQSQFTTAIISFSPRHVQV